tara:strand:- start:11571 stop:11804 length:234 start_codon:yes stop_codon:yes gene_type:complete
MKKRKANGLIPFGYKEIENDPEHIEEIPSHLEALDKIVPMIKSRSLSLREGALWLSHKTGRKLSHEGLNKIVKSRYE